MAAKSEPESKSPPAAELDELNRRIAEEAAKVTTAETKASPPTD